MKPFVRLTVALAMLIPVGALSAGPAGAAGGTTCKSPSGTLTFSPGVSSVAKVQTININLPISGCVGGGVKSGVFKGSLKTAAVAIKDLGKLSTNLKLTSTITWNTKKTSTLTASSKTTTGKVITSTVTGKISKGLFVGLNFKDVQTVTFGPIINNTIKTLKITGKGSLTIK